jgi:hypothetical protein
MRSTDWIDDEVCPAALAVAVDDDEARKALEHAKVAAERWDDELFNANRRFVPLPTVIDWPEFPERLCKDGQHVAVVLTLSPIRDSCQGFLYKNCLHLPRLTSCSQPD